MSDYSELVKRLRATDDDWPAGLLALEMEAADALEAQAAEIERLKTDYGLLCDTLRDDRAEVERLRAALVAITAHGDGAGCNPASFIEIARKALEDK